ncbi:hypothetical protein AB0O22_26125 [Streptomyces sp. NPDC091204]|uniref:hypothetical protein n=1 Tax=Streptomyces sp. NPDC091204 TaxID=3155299 RepID=UPI003441C295
MSEYGRRVVRTGAASAVASAFSYSSAFLSDIRSWPLAAWPERARFFGTGFCSPRAARGPGEAALSPVPLGLLARSMLARRASTRSMTPVGCAAGSAFSTVSPAAFAFTRALTFSRKESRKDSGSYSMARASISCMAIFTSAA